MLQPVQSSESTGPVRRENDMRKSKSNPEKTLFSSQQHNIISCGQHQPLLAYLGKLFVHGLLFHHIIISLHRILLLQLYVEISQWPEPMLNFSRAQGPCIYYPPHVFLSLLRQHPSSPIQSSSIPRDESPSKNQGKEIAPQISLQIL